MVVTTNSNIASLNVQRRFAQSTSSLQENFSRLSSGLRINKASDDAAGLAISESLNVDARVFAQGVRNLNDGLSTLSIADGAVEELTHIVIRLEELAEQAANGVLGVNQRQALDEEAQTLKSEYFRIAQSTEFNDQYLLRSSYGELSLQAGYSSSATISSSLGGVVGDGSFEQGIELTAGEGPFHDVFDIELSDLNGDGKLDFVTVGNSETLIFLGNGDGSFSRVQSLDLGDVSSNEVLALGDVNGDGVVDIITAGWGVSCGGEASVSLGKGDGSFDKSKSFLATEKECYAIDLADINGDGKLDLVSSGLDASSQGETNVFLGAGDGNFTELQSFSTLKGQDIELQDLNNDGHLDFVVVGSNGGGEAEVFLGDANGSFNKIQTLQTEGDVSYSLQIGDINGDDLLDMVTAGSSYGGYSSEVNVFLGEGGGLFSKKDAVYPNGLTSYGVTLGDLDGDGINDLITAGYDVGPSGKASVYSGRGDGSFQSVETFETEQNSTRALVLGDINGDGVLDLITAGDGQNEETTIFIGSTTSGVAPLLDFSLETQADAKQALPVFKSKLDQLLMQRAEIGAFQAKIQVAINNLQVEKENYIAARSQIVDTDIASESAELLRNQILQQAGAALLAQANSSPELALKLLSGV